MSADSPLTTASAIYTAWRMGRRAELRQLPDDVALRCERHMASPYRDLADVLLGLFGPRRWRWIDASGEERYGLRLPRAVLGVVQDLLTVPLILAWEYWRARTVLRRGRSAAKRVNTRAPLYLRMDHLFDLAAGGSVAHTSGVINALRALTGAVTVLSTDRLAMVATDERFHVITPRYGSGRNIPLIPLLTYNDQVLREWHSLNEVPGFVYARYSLGNYAGPMIAQRLGIPYVCEYNGSNIWIARNWGTRPLHFESLMALIEDVNLFCADLVIAVSQPSKEELLARGVPEACILVNPNGVDPDIYHPDRDGTKLRARLGIADRECVIGFIGTFGRWHGTEVLVDAFGELLADHPELHNRARLLMVGDGLQMPLVRAAIARHGIEEHVLLAGVVPQHEAPEYLAACDVLASPHVGNPDGSPFFGSPTKLFEYMAMGRAIVASDLDQIGEVLEHNVTGWLVPPGERTALAAALRVLIVDADLRTALGTAARSACLAKHTWRTHTAKILAALDQVASGWARL